MIVMGADLTDFDDHAEMPRTQIECRVFIRTDSRYD